MESIAEPLEGQEQTLARRVAMTPAQYHADNSRTSHSHLELFRDDPAVYESKIIFGHQKPATAAQDFGTIVHDAVLMGGENCCIVEIPQRILSSSGSRAGKAWQFFKAEHPGKFLLTIHELEPVRRAIDAVMSHRVVRRMIELPGHSEAVIHWTDPITGLPMKSMIDRLVGNVVGDLKTAAHMNSRRFRSHAYKMGYHRQAALYLDAAQQLIGQQMGFTWWVVSKDEPYTVKTYVPSQKMIQNGRDENRETIDDFAVCKESGVWRDKHFGELITLDD